MEEEMPTGFEIDTNKFSQGIIEIINEEFKKQKNDWKLQIEEIRKMVLDIEKKVDEITEKINSVETV